MLPCVYKERRVISTQYYWPLYVSKINLLCYIFN